MQAKDEERRRELDELEEKRREEMRRIEAENKARGEQYRREIEESRKAQEKLKEQLNAPGWFGKTLETLGKAALTVGWAPAGAVLNTLGGISRVLVDEETRFTQAQDRANSDVVNLWKKDGF
jgi:hypothetical protein